MASASPSTQHASAAVAGSRTHPLGCRCTACASDDYQVLTLPTSASSSAPTRQQLSTLVALPMGSVATTAGSRRRSKGKAQVQGKFFNVVAGRPFPSNRISLEQSIRAELMNTSNSFTTSTVATVYAGFSFAINTFSDYASYLALFDQYRIDQLEIWLEPLTPTAANFSELATCIDLDDGNTPTSIQQVAAHQQALVGTGSSGRYFKWRPHMALAAYSGAFTSYSNAPAGWIDSASPAVQHFGFKIAGLATVVAVSYQMTVRAVVSFRAPGIA